MNDVISAATFQVCLAGILSAADILPFKSNAQTYCMTEFITTERSFTKQAPESTAFFHNILKYFSLSKKGK
jgi:hypothetical protein